MTDDPGVMGNLPRSRPGRRSEKRASAAAARAPSSRPATGAAPRRAAKAARAAGAKPASKARATAPPPPPERGDPLTDAVRIATRIAGTGLGVAAGIVRRLPRP